MGSPRGPTLTNIFMCALEKRYLNDCPTQFKPVLYRRYVDDTLCLFNLRDDVVRFLQHIHSFHSNIKFTFEIEENNTLPFLDVLVKKESRCFSTRLYRKKTFTGLYTDFASLAPNKYKINLVTVLIYHAFHICSTYKLFMRKFLRSKQSSVTTAFLKIL